MSDETTNTGGSGVVVETAKDVGSNRPKTGELASFQGPAGTGGPATGRPAASGGKGGPEKNKGGRPTKNRAGFSKAKIDEVEDDPDIEASRQQFEDVLVGLLVTTTDGIADSRFELLKKKYPEAEARGLADKARLTATERKYFGAVVIKLWRKYLGDDFLYTTESVAAIYVVTYAMRNLEGFNQARKIEAELNAKPIAGAHQQSPVQSAARPAVGHVGNGEIRTGNQADSNSPREPQPRL